MSCEEEVISVRKQLEKMSKEGGDQTQALDLLKALGKLPINLQVLTNTRCIFCSWICFLPTGIAVHPIERCAKSFSLVNFAIN